MTSTSHHLLQNAASRPSRMIENYQQSFIPRRMPQGSRKQDDQTTPPLPPRTRDARKSTDGTEEFPPKGGISSLLKTSPNSSVLTQRYQYSRTAASSNQSSSTGAGGRSFSSLPRRMNVHDKAKNNLQVQETSKHESRGYSQRSSHGDSTGQGYVSSTRADTTLDSTKPDSSGPNKHTNVRNITEVRNSLSGQNKHTGVRKSSPVSYKPSEIQTHSSRDVPPTIPPRGLTHRVSTNGIPLSPSGTSGSVPMVTGSPPPTPEPQPLTRTNVTKHDIIWTVDKEADEGVSDLLSPPMKHLTPEVTAEMLVNFDPHDVLDSASDSSADTMIMMTTEEEKRNEESINHSMAKFETKKVLPDSEEELSVVPPEISNSIISKGNVDRSHLKVTFMSPKRQVSEDESLDDGYGTNSSSGTSLSSPLSSSSSSSTTNSDLENSCNHGNGGNNVKRDFKSVHQNGPVIKPSLTNTVTRNTWAVRRRNKMVESQDNSLQEKLRQLAIIEEEENTQNIQSAMDSNHGNSEVTTSNHVNSSYDRYEKGNTEFRGSKSQQSVENIGPPEDLRRFEGDLCDKFTDMDRNYRNYYDFDKTNENLKDDSKVLYFHQKTMKQNYGNDNYYNPHAHRNPQNMRQDTASQPPTCSGVPMLNLKSVVSMDTSGPNSTRSDYGGRIPYASDIPPMRSMSYQSNSSGVSSMGNMSSATDIVTTNTSCDNIFTNGGTDGMLHKGRFISVDNVNQNGRRPFFASSADIYNMFQSSGNNLATQINRPASYRHSFHEMPVSGNIMVDSSQLPPQQRPRAASASVTMQSKSSWSLFGSMFGKKKNKNSQQKLENSSEVQRKSATNGVQQPQERASTLKSSGKKSSQQKIFPKEPSKPVPPPPGQKQHYTVVPLIRTPKAQQMRNNPSGTMSRDQEVSHDQLSHDLSERAKSQTLPNRTNSNSSDHSVYKSRFQTVTTDEGDSQKLSTLV